jgi:7-cyano-7-deazaguanine synthase
VLLSGGIDSATCVYLMKDNGYSVRALTMVYGSMASRELDAAKSLARAARVKDHRIARLPDLKEAADIAGVRFVGLPATYVPMRNSIFYSYASSYSEEVGADVIVGGHNSEDARVFRDVGPKFFASLERTLWAGSARLEARKTRLIRPLEDRSKAEVIELAASLRVPLELTWSCNRDGQLHCWKCPGCRARRGSFQAAGIHDPVYPVRTGKIS